MADKNWQRIKFKCSKCGNESWTEFDVNTYILSVNDLVCDNCFVDGED